MRLAAAKRTMIDSRLSQGSLCSPFLEVAPVSGAGIAVFAGTRGRTLCATDRAARRIDELQFDLGEGPCWESMATRRPVLAPQLLRSHSSAWPFFTDSVRTDPVVASVSALYAFPLSVGALTLGAIDLYSTGSAGLSDSEVEDVQALAALAAWSVLRRIVDEEDEGVDSDPTAQTQDSPAQTPGGPAPMLSRVPQTHGREVHQATGMVLVQTGLSAEEALLLIRAHAFASGRSVSEVAVEVIERRLDLSSS